MARFEDPEEAITLARAILHTADPKEPDSQRTKFIMTLCQRIVEGYGVTFDEPVKEVD